MAKNKKSQKIKNFGKPKKEQKVEVAVKTPPATKPATSTAKAPPVTPKVAAPPVIARKPAAPPASENATIGHLVDIKFSSGRWGARQYYKWLVGDKCILQKINLDNTLEIGDSVEVTLGTHNGNPSVENTHKVVGTIEQLVGTKTLPEVEPEPGDTVVYPNELASAILRNSKVFKPKIKGWVGSQLVYS